MIDNKAKIVPMADLHAQYLSVKSEIDAAISKVIETSAFIRGPDVEAFETAFAAEIGTAHCISCANGTDAIYMAMVGLGVKPGDEVIVPAMSWISTSETVTQAGATVVFCDIDPISYTLDPAHLSDLITERTVGIIPVHLYGHPADMPAIMQVAARRGLWVIEDCAQAHLAEIGGRKVGTFGAAATFSFYPGKNLGAMGDAGAVVSNDAGLARRIAMFARHGGLRKGDHEIEGINSRMDGLQAAILNVKLPHLSPWTARRQALAAAYNAGLSGCDTLTIPRVSAGVSAVWHLYVLRSTARTKLEAHLKSHGIGSARNYPRALPFLPCYARLQHRPEDFPIASNLAEEGLSIPIFAEMTDQQLQRVVDVILGFDPSEDG
ncbi:DegT/DnrJ/EryC1/StrS family aminotransferase [Sulfitobacter sp. 1A15106]|uniref:DegT/DnrJ/EryC1/StrS family aminotransferase n=1 Tax=Sulfitobacter sp. 1A15106 TaxID=3368590 RepID=UPI003744BB80